MTQQLKGEKYQFKIKYFIIILEVKFIKNLENKLAPKETFKIFIK